MAKTDAKPNVEVDSVNVLDEMDILDLKGSDFSVNPNPVTGKVAVEINTTLTSGIEDNAIAYAVALG